MISPEEHNRIERLTKNLYSRKAPLTPVDDRPPISREEYAVREEWEHPQPELVAGPKKKGTLFKKVLIASLLFFFLSSGIAALMFFGGFNIISSQNVDIAVVGPISVAGGEVLSLDITVQNKNNTDLEVANLIVEYPEGTRSADNIAEEYLRHRESLGSISSGKTVTRPVKVFLFGEENSTRDIKITVEYKVKGSNATFYKEKIYPVALGSSPISLKVDALKEANSGQQTQFTVTMTSNSNTPLHNILLTAAYPFGFTFENASTSPSYGTAGWNIGTFEPGEKKVVVVSGRIEGQDGEERVFHWNVGIQNPEDKKVIQTTFLSVVSSVAVKRPFIGISVSFNGSSEKEYVAERGQSVKGEILWKNNLSSRITDAEIRVAINGKIVDRETISADGGFFRSVDNTIVWDKSNTSTFRDIGPGEEGKLGFAFNTFGLSKPEYAALTNQDISVVVSVEGKRSGDSGVPEAIASSLSRTVKIASNIAIAQRVTYSTGPFQNTGAIPPKVESPTTYTITWVATNASNNITNGRISAVLPSYMTWTGKFSPDGEKIAFNPQTNEVVWQIGSLPAKTGYQTAPRQVSFQVSFLPSLSQVGSMPVLVGGATFTARDAYTSASLKASAEPATTRMTNDPKGGFNSEQVVR